MIAFVLTDYLRALHIRALKENKDSLKHFIVEEESGYDINEKRCQSADGFICVHL